MSDDSRRAALLAAREALTRRAERLQRDVTAPLDDDFAEQATQLENRDVMLALGEEARSEVAEIDAALARIDSGRYGQCEVCGEPIPSARLDAYPAASRCVGCAEAD